MSKHRNRQAGRRKQVKKGTAPSDVLPRIEASGAVFVGKDAWNSQAEELRGYRQLALEAEQKKLADERKQSERRTFWITTASVAVAIVAAFAAVWSGYEAHLTRIEDERPYVRVEFSGFTNYTPSDFDDPKVTLRSEVRLSTFGKSPAVSMYVLTACEGTVQGRKVAGKSDIEGFGSLFPNENRSASCLLEDAHFGSIKLWGFVAYDDFHGNRYNTPFCFKSKATTAPRDLEPCDAGPGLK